MTVSPNSSKLLDKKSNNDGVDNIEPSLVPKGITIGLAIFTFVLIASGYGFRLAFGEQWQSVLQQAVILVPVFVIGVPLLFWLGATIMNKVTGMNIQRRNALSLGWLIASVTILWLMGTYS
ncbi:hypothetical protein [Psychrobacter sp. I-STPA10]|uniref:hypothetical protein n=1 Tax=Psychrobacter sp. I-STPA10 TaxID=2585769 RepID=UPI001E4CBEEA|nr:hypothetical protein [Psychrobacter sp. I-STPA10]